MELKHNTWYPFFKWPRIIFAHPPPPSPPSPPPPLLSLLSFSFSSSFSLSLSPHTLTLSLYIYITCSILILITLHTTKQSNWSCIADGKPTTESPHHFTWSISFFLFSLSLKLFLNLSVRFVYNYLSSIFLFIINY